MGVKCAFPYINQPFSLKMSHSNLTLQGYLNFNACKDFLKVFKIQIASENKDSLIEKFSRPSRQKCAVLFFFFSGAFKELQCNNMNKCIDLNYSHSFKAINK